MESRGRGGRDWRGGNEGEGVEAEGWMGLRDWRGEKWAGGIGGERMMRGRRIGSSRNRRRNRNGDRSGRMGLEEKGKCRTSERIGMQDAGRKI